MTSATARAHTNIALVKYWGKRDSELMLPQTDSLSLTLSEFYADTRVEFSNRLDHDELIIDGQSINDKGLKKVQKVLDLVRKMSHIDLAARVESENHVPMAAGLASSASAFAALAAAASTAAGLKMSRRDLSRLARRGSGSATRSIFGGLVEWHRGIDDLTSYAEPIMEEVDFPIEMMAILLNTEQKKVSSTLGMQHVVETSPYYPAWREVVAADMQKIKQAIDKHDINEIGHIAQTNALRMHALNLAADPGFTYFNDATLKAMHAVDDLRANGTNCYYTMDAGPNVKVIYDRADRNKIQAALSPLFGADNLIVSQPGPGTVLLDQE